MGKGIVIIFFIVGFVIFSVIKLAARGVKTAYDVVNEKTPSPQNNAIDEIVSTSINALSSLLQMQQMLMTSENGSLPSKSKDEWSIGYIAGYVDAYLQLKGISFNSTPKIAMYIMASVFISLYGEMEGHNLFNRFLDLQDDRDLTNLQGQKIGGEEMMDFICSDGKKTTLQWTSYVMDYE
ncbi:hypothetical protein TI24_07855 [Vibrio vulnificus]|uniref:hypothetical protein n=1 Tax=Vibrio vulnificus TaxID=672 RepID=UPI000B5AA957|nr:hypothetical protein [Vibrio vulnificus]ASJ37526.1 hypothetical protein VVCECT4999_01885 [Vibrio vulnificus]PNG69104.1 hypothetical protein TI24_07855 [Vibrio vulnificus]PNG75060.1 hypothetical protein TI31_09055 [Vibrio vulnificus]POC41260.1 hypothetical protein CRN50_01845 [Vibrio vulnificus]